MVWRCCAPQSSLRQHLARSKSAQDGLTWSALGADLWSFRGLAWLRIPKLLKSASSVLQGSPIWADLEQAGR